MLLQDLKKTGTVELGWEGEGEGGGVLPVAEKMAFLLKRAPYLTVAADAVTNRRDLR